jgi:hypothetical protein
MLVLGATGLVALASAGTQVQPSRFFATPINPQRHHMSHRRTPPARPHPDRSDAGRGDHALGRARPPDLEAEAGGVVPHHRLRSFRR